MSAKHEPVGAEVRATAATVLARVLRDGMAAEDALARASTSATRDAALLAALVFGALRWHHRLQWQAEQLLNRPLKVKQTELAALLRIGLLQLQYLRIPDHAAVSATVDAAALLGLRDAGGLVNAVLRRFQRERAELEARVIGDRQACFSHPQWLIELIEQDWPNDWRRILEQNNVPPPMWLRVNLRRVTRADYLARLAAAGVTATASPQAEAAVLLAEPQPVDSLPGFAEGHVSVQDAAAQLAVGFLAAQPGDRVLDACAAPGGKTGHILEACESLQELWALDRDPERLEKVADNLTRLGLTAAVVRGDATHPEEWWDGQPFDRILLDAPCTATGVIRRHPDIKVLRRPEDIQRVTGLQARLLKALWGLLAPGGRLVYATCSVLKQENDEQVLRFLGNTPDAELAGSAAVSLGAGFQTLPGEANMDGFYYACLDKQDVLRSSRVPFPQQ
ncbi:MAG TPA: 16S rRNA (cytosine(967)-C(5))-methyltransferase RsmB [Gammaproteobacteria bacterium]|nr:16S rRNA (cytosine(967)-C(5))-methyltransferase RsmB [Gammaproteobacteria bacterium]